MHCDWFHVFDFVGPAAMVGSQELPVPRRCWSIWGLVVSLGNNSGLWQNNLVPTVTASFDVLEAGDMVEGCSIWVSVRLGSNRCRLGCFLICRLLLRRLRFRFCVCGFDPVRNFCGWLLFSAPSLPRLCSARRLVSCRLFDPPTHYVSLVRECSDWGLA